jgi:hypothetical protein
MFMLVMLAAVQLPPASSISGKNQTVHDSYA